MGTSTIAKNLQALIDMFDTTQEAVARAANTSTASVSRWMGGDVQARYKYLENIARYYNLTMDDLTSEQNGLYAQLHGLTDAPEGAVRPDEPRRAYAPVRGRVHAGTPGEPDMLEGEAPIPYEVWERHKNGYLLEVEGTCMNRVYPEGCMVFIDPDREPQNGSIAVVSIDGADYIMRRLLVGSQTCILAPESFDDSWEDIVIRRNDGHSVKTAGTVVWYQPAKELE